MNFCAIKENFRSFHLPLICFRKEELKTEKCWSVTFQAFKFDMREV